MNELLSQTEFIRVSTEGILEEKGRIDMLTERTITKRALRRLAASRRGAGPRRARVVNTESRSSWPGDRPAIVAVVGSTARARSLARPLAEALAGRRRCVRVVTDQPAQWRQESPLPFHGLPARDTGRDRAAVLGHWLSQARQAQDRVVVDLAAEGTAEELARLVSTCDEVLWLVEPANFGPSWKRLQAVLQATPALARRVRLVWLRREREALPVGEHQELGLADPDFKMVVDADASPASPRREDLLRLVRHLRRASIGLALGGGGARGAAHVGVLRAFERAGVPIDMISGSSSGAIVGLSHACGYPLELMLDVFRKEMAAPRALRFLPWGKHWHMYWKYRSGSWRRRARHYFPDCTFEQLDIPLYLITTDLVTGKYLVRDRGDAREALLESINVPGLARPMLRDGAVLVDGGVLNNVPANMLRGRGANVVVAVDVAWKIEPSFAGNDPTVPTERMRSPGLVETLLRVIEVQQRALIAAEEEAADLVIAPEVMNFGFSDYHRAAEIAEAGEAAAAKVLPSLKRMLANLDDE